MGELPKGWSQDVILALFFQLCSQDSHHYDGGTGAFIPFYLKLPRIPWRGKSIPGSPAKPVALGKGGDKGLGDRPSGTKPLGEPPGCAGGVAVLSFRNSPQV